RPDVPPPSLADVTLWIGAPVSPRDYRLWRGETQDVGFNCRVDLSLGVVVLELGVDEDTVRKAVSRGLIEGTRAAWRRRTESLGGLRIPMAATPPAPNAEAGSGKLGAVLEIEPHCQPE